MSSSRNPRYNFCSNYKRNPGKISWGSPMKNTGKNKKRSLLQEPREKFRDVICDVSWDVILFWRTRDKFWNKSNENLFGKTREKISQGTLVAIPEKLLIFFSLDVFFLEILQKEIGQNSGILESSQRRIPEIFVRILKKMPIEIQKNLRDKRREKN